MSINQINTLFDLALFTSRAYSWSGYDDFEYFMHITLMLQIHTMTYNSPEHIAQVSFS